MKKVILLLVCVAVLLAAGAALIIVPLSMKYSVTQSARELGAHIAEYSSGGTVTAEYGGTSTSLSPGNVSALRSALTRSNMRRVLKTPDYDEAKAARIEFSDGAVYVVFDATPDGADEDTAYILYSFDGKTRTFKVEAMDTMKRVTECISPDGFEGANSVIN